MTSDVLANIRIYQKNSTAILEALARTGKHVYLGTVSGAEKARRRRRNRAARTAAASLLRVKREPDAAAIGVALQMTDSGTVVDPVSGEVVPGLGVEPESVSVSIKPGTST